MKKTLTEYVRESVRKDYINQENAAGCCLPPEGALAEKYKVSLITLRRAVDALSQEGLLAKKQGKGTFVVDPQSGKSCSIGLVIPENRGSPFYSTLSTLIEPMLRKRGHNVHLFVANDTDTLLKYLSADKNKVDGLLICGYIMRHQLLKKHELPYVLAGTEGSWDADCVSFDLKAGTYKAIRHMIEAGHKNILFLSNYHKDDPTLKRLKYSFHFQATERYIGYCEALDESGIDFNKQSLLHVGESKRESYLQISKLLTEQKRPDFTAIFASTDLIAEGAIQAIREHGLKVPQDISVMGCDNLRYEKDQVLPLSTLDLRLEEVAGRAIELLMDRIKSPDMEEHRCYALIPRLILRESCGSCPKQRMETK